MRGIVSIIGGGLALLLVLIGFYYMDNPNKEEATTVDPMEKMQTLAASSCVSCHGNDLTGNAVIPGLVDVGERLTKEQIVEVLKNGRNAMPANLVPGQEELMADYLLSLGQPQEAAPAEEQSK